MAPHFKEREKALKVPLHIGLTFDEEEGCFGAEQFGDFLEQMLRPDYHQHPDTAKLDFSKLEWQFNQSPWEPDLEKTIDENGIGHMDYLQSKSPDLPGMHGVGN